MISNASRRAFTNTSACVIGGVLQKGCGLWLLHITVSGMESIRPGMFGEWSVVLTLLGYAGALADFQFDLILLTEFSKEIIPPARVLGNGVFIKFLLAIVACTGLMLLLPFTPYSFGMKIAVIVGSFSLFSGMLGVFRVYCQSKLESLFINVIQLSSAFLLLFGFAFLIARHATLIEFAMVQVLATIPGDIFIACRVLKSVHPDFTPDLILIRSFLAQTLIPGLGSVITIIAYRYDVILLSLFRSSKEVGMYAASFRLTEALSFIPGAAIKSIYPLLCRIKDPSEAYPILLRWMMIPGAAVLALFLSCGDAILSLMYGKEMLEASGVIRWLGVAECIMFLSPLPFFILIASGKRKEFIVSVCVFVSVNILSNSLLTPKYGVVYAAVCTALTELTAFTIGSILLLGNSKFRFQGKTSSIFLGCIATLIVMRQLGGLHPLLKIVLCLGTYCIAQILTRGVNREDIRLLRTALLRE
jgi:O-antigen/teichoic acid export membrane protein